jgi:hypothetical protein
MLSSSAWKCLTQAYTESEASGLCHLSATDLRSMACTQPSSSVARARDVLNAHRGKQGQLMHSNTPY